MKKIRKKFKRWGTLFCKGMTCRKHIKRDFLIVILLLLFASGFFIGNSLYGSKRVHKEKILTQPPTSGIAAQEVISEEEAVKGITEEFAEIVESIDTSKWKPYQNSWYGFSVAYPAEGWLPPVREAAKTPAKWESRYKFRLKDSADKPYLGFDVIIYPVVKAKQLSDTEEYPLIKNEELKDQERCRSIEGHVLEPGDYPVELMYIPPTDECFQEALFFSLIKDQYIYNVVPVFKPELSSDYDKRTYIGGTFPELYAIASKLELIPIKRPKPAPARPKITAPMPVSFKVVGGRLVCANKNDKPSKSKKGKGKHLDMECCLDPDEYPNPHCYYSPEKYGKYLK